MPRDRPPTVHAAPAFRPLVVAFIDDARRDVAALRDALERGDAEAVRETGHSLKGAGGGYGLDAVTEYGAAMQRAAEAGDLAAAGQAVDGLATYLDAVVVVAAEG